MKADDDRVVSRTEGGEWLNYTREFSPGDYIAYLRAAGRAPQEVLVSLVDDATSANQTLEQVGKFNVRSTMSGQTFEYFQLVDDAGEPATVALSGEHTLRLTIGGEDGAFETKHTLFMNYLMLLPKSANSNSFGIQEVQYIPGQLPRFDIKWNSIPGYNYSIEYGAGPDALILELEDLVAEDSISAFLDTDPERLSMKSGYYRIRERRP